MRNDLFSCRYIFQCLSCTFFCYWRFDACQTLTEFYPLDHQVRWLIRRHVWVQYVALALSLPTCWWSLPVCVYYDLRIVSVSSSLSWLVFAPSWSSSPSHHTTEHITNAIWRCDKPTLLFEPRDMSVSESRERESALDCSMVWHDRDDSQATNPVHTSTWKA